MKRIAIAIALLIAGCRDEAPAPPTAEQASQLDDAEAMLNAMANEEGPANRSAGPSKKQ